MKQKNKSENVENANCVDLKQKRMKEEKKNMAKTHLDASPSHYSMQHNVVNSFIHVWHFGFCVYTDYRVCASVAFKSMREKKKKRFVVEANKIVWPLWLFC